MKTAKAKPGIGMVTSAGLPWVAKRILEAASWIKDGKDYAPATVVRMLRESRGNMQEFWYAWSELLEIAYDKFDWSQPVVLDRDDREKYECADDFYRREVEPFLGPLERLRTVAGLYRKGEITHDEGERQLRKIDMAYAVAVEHPEMSVRQVAAEAGVSERTAASAMSCKKNGSLPKKLQTITDESASTGLSTATIYRQRRLKADHPELWAEVEAGTKSTHAAAIAAGIFKPASVPDQIRKLWSKLTPAERAQLLEELKP